MKRHVLDAQRRLRNGWKMLAFLVLLALVLAPAMLVLYRLAPAVRPFVPKVAVIDLGVLLVTWICVRAEGATLASVGLRPDWRFAGQLVAGIAGGVALLALSALLVWLGDGVHLVRVATDTAWNVVRGAGVMLGVGVMEELVFRGYPLQRAIRGLGMRPAMALLAVLFCLCHPLDAGMSTGMKGVAMLNIFLWALVMSLAWWRTGSLAASIGLHTGWNWAQQTLGFGVSGIASRGWWAPVFHGAPDWLTGGAFGLEASAACTLVVVATLGGLLFWHPRPAARAGVPGGRARRLSTAPGAAQGTMRR